MCLCAVDRMIIQYNSVQLLARSLLYCVMRHAHTKLCSVYELASLSPLGDTMQWLFIYFTKRFQYKNGHNKRTRYKIIGSGYWVCVWYVAMTPKVGCKNIIRCLLDWARVWDVFYEVYYFNNKISLSPYSIFIIRSIVMTNSNNSEGGADWNLYNWGIMIMMMVWCWWMKHISVIIQNKLRAISAGRISIREISVGRISFCVENCWKSQENRTKLYYGRVQAIFQLVI